jgi:hypothetical protein
VQTGDGGLAADNRTSKKIWSQKVTLKINSPDNDTDPAGDWGGLRINYFGFPFPDQFVLPSPE